MIKDWNLFNKTIELALEEDIGPGDLTSDVVIEPRLTGQAALIIREEVVLAGLPVFKQVFQTIDSSVKFTDFFSDGEFIPAGNTICVVRGPLRSILKGERTALNFLQRMSGIATLTHRYVEKTKSFDIKILDTRKTAPGLRWFDKYAVRTGGGTNHRFGLFDGVLIKDNHIASAGSIANAVAQIKKKTPHTIKIELEVENLTELEEALAAGVDIIMLDNMSLEEMKQAVALVNGRAMLEASGGINLNTIVDIAKTGVNFISVGALTHSAKAADFSLKIGICNPS
jgi:nicotinate-nucleotide pyrophosphorylase (carboxylating)